MGIIGIGGFISVSLAHPFVPAPRWLLIHLTLLGAVTHAIFVWSRHFADALLHLKPGTREHPASYSRQPKYVHGQ